MLLDDVVCSGKEISLSQCSHNGWGINNCRIADEPYTQDIGVRCYESYGKFQWEEVHKIPNDT